MCHCADGKRVSPQRARKRRREIVGGVVMMRYGENPLQVTERIHRRFAIFSADCLMACALGLSMSEHA
jgi:Cu/Ag efflux pump CusA